MIRRGEALTFIPTEAVDHNMAVKIGPRDTPGYGDL